MKFIAKVFSVILHPLLMPTYLFTLILFFFPLLASSSSLFKVYLLTYVFGITFIIPAVSIFFMYRMNLISSLAISERKERTYPLAVTTFIYAVASYLFVADPTFDPLYGNTLLVITITMAVVTFITKYTKISAHAVGLAGVAGVLLRFAGTFHYPIYIYLFLGAVIALGIGASCRLILHAHRPVEVLAGSLLGLIISVFSFPVILD